MNANPNTYCPVCGYDLKLDSPELVVERCPSCAFDFRELDESALPFNHFDRENLFVRVRRGTWIDSRMPWCSTGIPRPENWDPVVQMNNIGFRLADSFAAWEENNPVIAPENGPTFLAIVLRRIKAIPWEPKVIEAHWDGDTQGWRLYLTASTNEQIDGKVPYDVTILRLREGGGDFRLFTGEVPPWPEAVVASYVGEQLSKILGIPFYFPASEQPNDDYAGWWERDEQHRCSVCGRYLRVDPPAQNPCYTCTLHKKYKV